MNTDTKKRREDEASDEEPELTPADLQTLRDRLHGERDKLTERIRSHLEAAEEGDRQLADEMDLAARDQDRGYVLRLADKEQKLMQEIDHALAKIEAGTYGLCEGTGEPIGAGRLLARPWARYSIAYKEQLEREERDEKAWGR